MSDVAGIFAGLALTIFGGLVIFGLGAAIIEANEAAGVIIMFGTGLIQLLYVYPVYRKAIATKNLGLKTGLVVGGLIVLVINIGAGLLLWLYSKADFR